MSRRVLMVLMLGSLAFAAACGDDGGGDDDTDGVTPDSPPSGNKVTTVTCPAGPNATVATNTAGTAFVPMTVQVPAGGTVRFMLGSTHNVVPATSSDDAGLRVPFGGNVCLQFAEAGTYNFKCEPHNFSGTVTVQ